MTSTTEPRLCQMCQADISRRHPHAIYCIECGYQRRLANELKRRNAPKIRIAELEARNRELEEELRQLREGHSQTVCAGHQSPSAGREE